MISSVSLDAERELTDGALFYAREANAELGLAFIAEFERSLGVLCSYPRLGPDLRPNRTIDADRWPAGFARRPTAGHRDRWASEDEPWIGESLE